MPVRVDPTSELLEAAERGDVRAMRALTLVLRDDAQRWAWLRRAAAEGDPEALEDLRAWIVGAPERAVREDLVVFDRGLGERVGRALLRRALPYVGALDPDAAGLRGFYGQRPDLFTRDEALALSRPHQLLQLVLVAPAAALATLAAIHAGGSAAVLLACALGFLIGWALFAAIVRRFPPRHGWAGDR